MFLTQLHGSATLTLLTAGTAYTLGMGAGAARAETAGTNFEAERECTDVTVLKMAICIQFVMHKLVAINSVFNL